MAEYLTRSRIIASAGPLAEQASTVRKAEARSVKGATFLSHSSKDAQLLPGVITILENHGASVYVDKKDEALPPYTSRKTAEILRSRIRECKKFILLASSNSKASKWVPWELGISDGTRSASRTAIFPAIDSAGDYKWVEQEYLGVYDRVVYGLLEGFSNPVYMVLNQEKNEASELSAWLNA